MSRRALVSIDLSSKLGTISPMLYGIRCALQFNETKNLIWVGENSEIENIGGIRKDTTEALKKISPGFMTAIGGTFYHWMDGIGPREKRPVRVCWWGRSPFEAVELEWRMDFGTDEFVKFCRLSGAEPMIICNEDEPEESRNWLEYCNYEGNSSWARLRAENGQKEPYKVKYWNVYGWMDINAEIYAVQYRKFALHARLIDPDIKLIAAGSFGGWDIKLFETLEKCNNPNMCGTTLIDYLSRIVYTGASFPEVDYNDSEYYRVIQNSAGLDNEISKSIELIDRYTNKRKPWGTAAWGDMNWIGRTDVGTPEIGLAYLEWGTRHTLHRQTMRDAIAHAYMLDAFHHRARRTSIASHWVNMLLQCEGDKLWVTPTYHLFGIYQYHRNNESVAVNVECDMIKEGSNGREEEFAGGAAFTEIPSLPVISSSASISPCGDELVISITNCHLIDYAEVKVNIAGFGKPVEGLLYTLSSESVRDYNDAENPDRVMPKLQEFTPDDEYFTLNLNPCSVNTLILKKRGECL